MPLDDRFTNLVNAKGRQLLDDESAYHIVGLIRKFGEDEIYDFLSPNGSNETDWKDGATAIYAHSIFDNARKVRLLEYELYQNKTIPPVDAPSCPRCGSNNVTTTGRQMRGLDEGGTAKSTCGACGNVFDPKF